MPFCKKFKTLNFKAYETFKHNNIEFHMSEQCPYCKLQKNDLLEMDRRFNYLIKYPKKPLKGVVGYPTIIIYKNDINTTTDDSDLDESDYTLIMGYKNKEKLLELAKRLDNNSL
jgi:hypothetical protein